VLTIDQGWLKEPKIPALKRMACNGPKKGILAFTVASKNAYVYE